MITRSIESAQRRVDNRNYEIRKHVLEYDDVMNMQREVIYGQRRQVLMGVNIKESIEDMLEKVVRETVDMFSAESPYPEEWDLKSFLEYVENLFLPNHSITPEQITSLEKEEIVEMLLEKAHAHYKAREEAFGEELMREIERAVMLQVVDRKWMDHLDAMDMLREGIGLRAYGQKNPLVEYRREAFEMFEGMISSIREDTIRYIMRVTPQVTEQKHEEPQRIRTNRDEEQPARPIQKEGPQIGRNDPCPCGSGKKYKKCCGADK